MSFLRPLRLAALGLASLAVAASAAADPALWVVKDKDSTIYLFGTVHVLKPTTKWRGPKLDKALTDAEQLYMELPTSDPSAAQGELMPLVAKYALAQGKPLSSLLNEEEKKTLAQAATDLGLPAAQLDMFRPWFAAMSLEAATVQHAGYDPASGVEPKVEKVFKDAKEPVAGLETFESQIRALADLPPDVELTYLRETLKGYKEGAGELDRIVAAWAKGDVKAIERQGVTDMKKEAPLVYDALLVKRNVGFADKIETMLKGKGVVFIAVGAAHLVGPDSVQAKLKARGIKTTRAQ